MEPLEIIQILPGQLHNHWAFLEVGLNEIVEDEHPDWIPPDIYCGIQTGRMECFLVKRAERALAFIVGLVQPRGFSEKKDYHILIVWGLHLKDRIPEDHPLEVRRELIEFVRMRKEIYKCEAASLWSARNGWEKYNFKRFMQIWRSI